MAGKEIDWKEVQGIVLSGYPDKRSTRYYLLTIVDVAAARAWLSDELKRGTISFADDHMKAEGQKKAEDGKKAKDGENADRSVNIAFTRAGLEKMGLLQDAVDTFPWDFRDGMASPLRRRILGDFDRNDPSKWEWGRCDQDLHILVMVHAKKTKLATCAAKLEGRWKSVFLQPPIELSEGYLPNDTREHFGFADGLSQPAIETSPRSQKLRERGDVDGIIQPGEFILGYVNERGQLPVSPSVAFEPHSGLPVITNADRSVSGHPANTRFPRLDFGRNGSFLVFRQLEQDVFAFADLIENAAKLLGDGSTPRLSDETDFRRLLAAKVIGRWDDGTSLTLAPNSPPPAGSDLQTVNSFGYADEDRYGLRCPIGAHVRRANPRDTLDEDPRVAIRRNRRHRLLRRGRIYGKRTFGEYKRTFREAGQGWHAWDDEKKPIDRQKRGLHFVAINASIESQFEFIQQTWMNTPFFGSLTDELDPLIGMPDAGDNPPRFTIQGAPINRRFPLSLSRPLVTVRGGAYFFLPSRAALTFLAR
jgi:deferrochelatase/peroxidase EfeB